MKTSRLLSLILCTLLLLSWQVETAYAQTVVNYNYVVKKITKDINGNNNTQEAPGFYRYYLNYADAVKDYNKMLSIFKQNPHINIDDKEIRGDFALQRTSKGFFSFNGVNGMGVIFGLEETKELILIKQDDANWQNYKIGKTSRDNTFEYKCRKIAANQYEYEVLVRGEVQLEALNVTGKYKRKTKEEFICGIHDDYANYLYHVILPKCKKEKKNRILVLPSIIDCETGDTVEHLMPASYEGKSYHKNNSKKKGADAIMTNNFIKHIEDLDHDDMGNIMIDSIIKYKKPTSKKYYRCSFKFYIEDAKHVLYEMEEPGTCERTIPFANITMDLPLTEEFYESPLEKPFDASESLDFNFKHGTAEIIEDAAYNASMQKLRELISDIEGKGGMILSADLSAYASPDGNDKINKDLADKRAKSAKEKISIGSLAKIQIKTIPYIDTWYHTAEMLEDAEHPAEAQVIRDALERHNKNSQAAYQDIRKCPTYADVIKPTLQKQCRIEFSARYWGKRLLTPKEAVAAYKENKNGIFSNGDYFNIYAELNDSAETDELTEIVYNRIIKKGEQYDRPIATYVMNKMAMLSIKRSTPDSTILMPLINENINKLNVIKNDPEGIKDSYIQNRPEVLLNQAIIYYMMGDINKAAEFIHILDINGWNSDELRKLKKIIF